MKNAGGDSSSSIDPYYGDGLEQKRQRVIDPPKPEVTQPQQEVAWSIPTASAAQTPSAPPPTAATVNDTWEANNAVANAIEADLMSTTSQWQAAAATGTPAGPTPGAAVVAASATGVESAVTVNDHESNDSGKCTKWESINAVKPLGDWNPNPTPGAAAVSNSVAATNSAASTAEPAWATPAQPVVENPVAAQEQWQTPAEPAASTTKWLEETSKVWSTAAAAVEEKAAAGATPWGNPVPKVNESNGLASASASASAWPEAPKSTWTASSPEMVAVNPKDVSPMDIDEVYRTSATSVASGGSSGGVVQTTGVLNQDQQFGVAKGI